METFKKVVIFLALFIAIIGAGCSLGWLAYLKEWVAFVGAVVVVAFAVPTWLRLCKKLID